MFEQTEAIVEWHKSNTCAWSDACVEVAVLPDGTVGVRDSKDPEGPVLEFTGTEWSVFVAGVRSGQFDVA